jgi:IS4 transposase
MSELFKRFCTFFETAGDLRTGLKAGAFTRKRDLTLKVVLFSLLADAGRHFTPGTGRLLQTLWLLRCFPQRRNGPPSEEAYRKACHKLPVELVREAAKQTHQCARSPDDELYEGLRVKLADGTKIIVPRTSETVRAYGLGSGSTGDAYYPQIHAVGLLDLATGTLADVNFDHGVPAERQVVLQDARQAPEPTLYVCDAGHNGMAHAYLFGLTGQHILMDLKMGELAERFRKNRKRSALVQITLNKAHLKNYPDCAQLVGTTFTVRLIRTYGTSKLRPRVLLTTLLDEKRYKWRDLARLYLQRWRIELAFRHLKMVLRLEHIRKERLERIHQLLWAAVMFYNLGGVIRNRLKCPQLFPPKARIKIHCFAFILELAEGFFLAVISPRRGQKTELRQRLRAMRNCWFLYEPWRVRPRICQFPASVFTRQKSTAKNAEYEKCEAIREDMHLLGIKYGQIEP